METKRLNTLRLASWGGLVIAIGWHVGFQMAQGPSDSRAYRGPIWPRIPVVTAEYRGNEFYSWAAPASYWPRP